jgi:hypothetical protein
VPWSGNWVMSVPSSATMTWAPSRYFAAIIIPGQSGTYRYLRSRITGLLVESGLTTAPPRLPGSALLVPKRHLGVGAGHRHTYSGGCHAYAALPVWPQAVV